MFAFYTHDMIWLYLSLRFYINTTKQNYPGLEEIIKEIDCFSEEILGFRCQPEFEFNVGEAVQIVRRASALSLSDIHTGNCSLYCDSGYRMELVILITNYEVKFVGPFICAKLNVYSLKPQYCIGK